MLADQNAADCAQRALGRTVLRLAKHSTLEETIQVLNPLHDVARGRLGVADVGDIHPQLRRELVPFPSHEIADSTLCEGGDDDARRPLALLGVSEAGDKRRLGPLSECHLPRLLSRLTTTRLVVLILVPLVVSERAILTDHPQNQAHVKVLLSYLYNNIKIIKSQ